MTASGSIVAELAARPHASKVVTWPGTDREVRMVVLRAGEVLDARALAHLRLKSKLGPSAPDPAMADPESLTAAVLRDLEATEVLAKALRHVEPSGTDHAGHPIHEPLFANGAALGRQLTTDDLAILATKYKFAELELGPLKVGLTPGEMSEFLHRVALVGMDPLAEMTVADMAQLAAFACSRAGKLRRRLEDAGLPAGDPPEDPADDVVPDATPLVVEDA